MIIQEIESLKDWLTQSLTPICNADAATLSKYVVALLKKDLPPAGLKALCNDQLDVFLHDKNDWDGVVECDVVEGPGEHIKEEEVEKAIRQMKMGKAGGHIGVVGELFRAAGQPECVGFVDLLFDALNSKAYIKATAPPPALVTPVYLSLPERPDPLPVKHIQPTPIINDHRKPNVEVLDKADPNKDIGSRRRHSRSLSPRQTRRNNDRINDDRHRRYDNRGRYHGRDDRRWRSRSRSRGRSPHGRAPWSNKDKPRRSPPHPPHPRSRSKTPSYPKNDLRKLIPKGNNTPVPLHDSRSPTPIAENGSRFETKDPPTSSSTPIAVVTSSGGDKGRYMGSGSPPPPHRSRLRCRDYDEKGYCMRGDMCPFDHGSDPLVVEEIDMPSDMTFGPNPPGPLVPGPPSMVPPPPGALRGSAPMGPRPPPRMPFPRPPMNEPYLQEGYNPEEPAITGSHIPSLPPPFWVRPPPPLPIPHTGMPPMLPRFHPPPLRALVTPNQPTPPGELQRIESIPVAHNRLVLPPKHMSPHPVTVTTTATQGPVSHTESTAVNASAAQKRSFDFNRLGSFRKPGYNPANMTLEVRKVPREFNTILKLNEHFSKFGTLVNVQVSYNNDPEAALVTFARYCDALSAYRSSDPLFHNRFIKVFWYTPDENSTTPEAPKMALKPRITIPPSHKLQFNKKIPQDTGEKSVVYTNEGSLKRTVFNTSTDETIPNAATPAATDSQLTVERVAKLSSPPDSQQKTMALKKNLEIQKQKQLLLTKYIDQQKLLISKLETKKTSEEKSTIMKTIKPLADSIDKLKLELDPKKVDRSMSISETKRDLLDTELDLINKENSGMDTTDLRMRLNQLQNQASSLGLMSKGRGRGWRGRRGGSSWSMRGQHRLNKATRTIDRRSKQIEVTGFNTDTRELLLPHLTQHGAVETITYNDAGVSALVTFKTRMDAEKASIKGIRFGDDVLKMRWHEAGGTVPVSQDDTEDTEVVTEEIDEDALLAADDEEEEDEESRSWRR